MDSITKNYFSVSELAYLGNISRQAILYYDKHNLLKPNFIDDNGYRYYHFKEYLMLELILNFRSLGMSIDEIKLYINNRSTDTLENLLVSKIEEYENKIKHMQCLINDMNIIKQQLNTINNYPIDTFKVIYQEEELLLLSPLISKNSPIKERIKTLGNFNLTIYKSGHIKSSPVSWIIKKQDFFSNNCKEKRYYCLPITTNTNNKQNIIALPKGRYLIYTFQGSFQAQANEIKNKIIDYLNNNNLKIMSSIKISILKDFWTTNDRKNYISVISVAIAEA